jgi:caffeoyl-CoA O-methyltransferase
MEFFDPKLQEYINNYTDEEPVLLKRLGRETYAKVMMPRMLSGHFQGRVLSMFSKMIKPQNILEIGTYTGYSAICMAEGLSLGGKLVTIDINEELEGMVRRYFEEAGLNEVIDYKIGNALEIIPNLDQKFDLVFIDADKDNYSAYYDLIFDKVHSGGYIMADNVLWSGKVIASDGNKVDKDTKAILEFNEKVQKDSRVENVLFPIRDGIMVVRKK